MSQTEQLSKDLGAAVETAGAAVVRVEARRGPAGSGVVWSPEGMIVAADHIVERDEDIRVGLGGGQAVAAAVVGRDPTTDVVLLRAEVSGLTPAAWSDLSGLRVGSLALALSRPGRSVRAHLGIISALGDAWRSPAGGEIDRYVEADVEMTWGFSGGLLVDPSGKAIGMTTAGLMRRTPLVLPGTTLEKVVEALRVHGRIRRGYLGVGAHPVRLPQTMVDRLGQRVGLIVIAVEPGSPAEHGGVVLGDVLLAAGSTPVRGLHDLQAQLGPEATGKPLSLRILRGGVPHDITVTVGER